MALDPNAVKAADAAFYKAHPERKGKPIQKGEPGFDALAKEWKALYDEAQAGPKDPPKPKPAAESPSKELPPKKEPKNNVGEENTGQPDGDCPPEPEEQKVTIRVSMFFDGTLNNKDNIDAGTDTSWYVFGKGEGSSYDNGRTNIARLEENWLGYKAPKPDHFTRLYIEGAGTETGSGDHMQGTAWGVGSTGVEAKVASGLQQLVGWIEDEVTIKKVKSIELDVFGFSRGAASARNFVWACLENDDVDQRLENRLTSGSFESIDSIKFVFIGLYDTVASFGKSFSDDTAQLHLDAIAVAQRVVQLAAADEHRQNFSLTDIQSVGPGRGVQIFLPGVHSDVGGSYKEGGAEEELDLLDYDVAWMNSADYARFERERQWLIDSGWYTANEIAIPTAWNDGGSNELIVNRASISEKYSYIPLQMMADYASDEDLDFTGTLTTEFKIEGATLLAAKAGIDAYVASKAGACPGSTGFTSKPTDWFTYPAACAKQPYMKDLRHDYLHFSSYYKGVGLHPHWTTSQEVGDRQRVIRFG
jgi:hypothetical protein